MARHRRDRVRVTQSILSNYNRLAIALFAAFFSASLIAARWLVRAIASSHIKGTLEDWHSCICAFDLAGQTWWA
jgi:hypothetical protein